MHDWTRFVRDRLPELPLRPEREADIIRELAAQLEQAYCDAIAGGASERDALTRAETQFPNWSALARDIIAAERHSPEICPPGSPFAGLSNDIRSALRLVVAHRSLSAAALLTLALGIGATTTVFTVFDHVIVHPLRFRDPDRLMALETIKEQEPERESWTSAPDFFDLRDRTRCFDSVAGISPSWSLVLTGRGPAERVTALFVSAAFFPMLGVKPALGRVFDASEDKPPGANVVVLSYSTWQRRFGGDPGVIGTSIALDGGQKTVVGVLPPAFRYGGEALAGARDEIDLYAPLAANMLIGRGRSLRFVTVVARLRYGVNSRTAAAEVKALGAALAAAHPESNRGYTFRAISLGERVAGRLRGPLLLALGAVGLVLLIASTNVAGLLLARAAGRTREIAVRMALGASIARIVQQLLTEAMAFAVAGGLTGALLGYGMLQALLALAPENMFRPDIALDARAVLFAAGLVLLAGIASALPPAWRVARADLTAALGQASRAIANGNRALRSALVVSQMAIAVVLLIGSGLLIRSFLRVLAIEPGFNAHNLITLSTQVPPSAAESPDKRFAILRRLTDRLLELPGVTRVAAVSRLPLGGAAISSWIHFEGRPDREDERPEVEYRIATPS